MKKSEILAELASHLDVDRLIAAHPGLDRAALGALLGEAAAKIGPGELETPEKKQHRPRARRGKRLIIHSDGASRGNPGEAGLGALIEDEDGQVLARLARYLGKATNNHAEYAALIEALRAAVELGAGEVAVHADSELVVKQVKGEYRVKHPDLIPMHAEVMSLLSKFSGYVIKYVPRERNKEADALANEAIDKRLAGQAKS
jgi:ribonuclease HI